jgi:hypothetical protein
MAEEKWNDFEDALIDTHPPDGTKVRAELASGKQGPATYFTDGGFVLFNLPWGEGSPVTRWQRWEWT